MKPILVDGRLTVELNKREEDILAKARDIAVLLVELHQPTGEPLVAALDKII
jgi:hypothetical protein